MAEAGEPEAPAPVASATQQEDDETSRVRLRKSSYGFGSVPGIRPLEATSQTGAEFKRPVLAFFPTYQLDPFKKFHNPTAQGVLNDILDSLWDGHKYHPTESPALAMTIAGTVMRAMKELEFNRYRIITVVTIAQKRKQSYANTIGFIWDSDRDSYVDEHREEHTAFIQVTVFGVYLD